MIQLLVALSMLFSTIVDGQIVLDEPVEYPSGFRDLYVLVQDKRPGWVFDECKPKERKDPYLTWQQSLELFTNTSEQFEDRAFGMLMLLFIAPKEYAFDICGDADGKPILYGPGVQEFLDWYNDPEGYESNRYPQIALGLARNLERIFTIFFAPHPAKIIESRRR